MESSHDESKDARIVADYLGSTHQEIFFSQQEIRLTEFKKEIHEEYGKCNIDIDTGKIEKVDEDEQTDKKD